MRRFLLFWVIIIFYFGMTRAQVAGAQGDLIFEDTLSFRPLYPWISITSPNENIWQTGQLQKDILGNTLSYNNWIVTDTLDGYTAEADYFFDIILPAVDSSWGEGILSFYHKYQTDALTDGGFIEVSYNEGQTWENIVYDEGHISTNFIGLYNSSDTITGNIPAFTGSHPEWSYVELYWYWIALVKKKGSGNWGYGRPIIRFRFISDSVNTYKDGWLIDQIVFRGYSITGGLTNPESGKFRIYPNPFSNAVYISIPSEIQSVIMKISSMDGRLVFNKKIHSSESIDLSFLKKGIYVYHLYDEQTKIESGIYVHQ